MTSREEFEAWLKARFPHGCPSETDAATVALEAWQAARAGMVREDEIQRATMKDG